MRAFVTRETDASVTKDRKGSSSVGEIKSAEVSTSSGSSDVACLSKTGPGYEIVWLGESRPTLSQVMREFVEIAPGDDGSFSVVGSGPGSMGTSLRNAIAAVNNGARVWRGEEK
jgi:hypothetical protein